MTPCRDCGKLFRLQPLLDLPMPSRCLECLIGLEAEVARLRDALEEIAYMCATGYYQPGNVTYAEEAKRIARAALAEVLP